MNYLVLYRTIEDLFANEFPSIFLGFLVLTFYNNKDKFNKLLTGDSNNKVIRNTDCLNNF